VAEKISVEHLIPYTDRKDLGEAAYFNMQNIDEYKLASAIAILLHRNAGAGADIYRQGNMVGISVDKLTNMTGKKFKIIVVECD
jgi:hypothetical protein